MNRVYKKRHYNLYQFGNEYIIHNTRKDFNIGHTHINNYKTAVFLIDLSLHKSVPRHICNYFLESLCRISDDKKYIQKLKLIIKQRENERKYKSKR